MRSARPPVMFLLLFPFILSAGTVEPTPVPVVSIQVYFSPDGGCTDAIVREVDHAQSIIRIQAYAFTSQPIAKAVIDAKKRGVQVDAVLDKANRTAQYSAATFLRNQGGGGSNRR